MEHHYLGNVGPTILPLEFVLGFSFVCLGFFFSFLMSLFPMLRSFKGRVCCRESPSTPHS